jgi:Domain of unknown function (DUF1707)
VSEQHPELRVSDAEREATVVRLREAGGEGRLTLEELAERVEAADAARTRGALMGGNSGPDDRVLPLPNSPIVRVRAFSLMGGVGVERRKGRTRGRP